MARPRKTFTPTSLTTTAPSEDPKNSHTPSPANAPDPLSKRLRASYSEAALPASFLNSLVTEETDFALYTLHEEARLNELLTKSDAASATAAAKNLVDKQLLSATPQAIRTLVTISQFGEEKNRVAAASKLLDKSPITQAQSGGSGNSLPPETLSVLVSGLASFMSNVLQSASPPEPRNVTPGDSNAIIIDDSSVSAPLVTRTNLAVHRSGLQTKAQAKRKSPQ